MSVQLFKNVCADMYIINNNADIYVCAYDRQRFPYILLKNVS